MIQQKEKDCNTVIASIETDNFKTSINSSNHSLIADEPKSFGGKDLGMSPFALLLSSLGACTAITLRMYANQKGWDLEEVKVYLNFKTSDNYEITEITKELDIKGNLSEEQIDRLKVISEKCPVQKVLTNKIKINTSIIK